MSHSTGTARGTAIGVIALIAILAVIALIAVGAIMGGPWRWVLGAAAVIGVVLIVAPGFAEGKADNEIGEK